MPKSFFNPEKILDATDRATAKALKADGAYVRKIAQNSIRPASGPQDHAAPGSPPKDHFGAVARIEARKLRKQGITPPARRGAALGIRNIQFDLDSGGSGGQALIVGMVGSGNDYADGTTVPELFERGGEVPLTRGKNKGKRARYAPHPVIKPALEKAIKAGKLLEPFKDSIK